MAFIRKRISQTKRQTPSYQLIETYREGGKVKQRIIENLGKCATIAEAINNEQWCLELWEETYRNHPISESLVRKYGRQIPPTLLRKDGAERDENIRSIKARIKRLKSFDVASAKGKARARKRAEKGK